MNARLRVRLVELLARMLRAPVVLIGQQIRSTPEVHGDATRLAIHPTATLNDALLNTESGSITIAENVFFGHQVALLTGRHDIETFGENRRRSIPTQGGDIVIETGAWIATRAIIIGPCTVGKHAVVGAGSVVTSSVPPYAVVVGAPARVVRVINHVGMDGSDG